MQALANDQFTADITGLTPNDTVRYYIEATNTHNKTAFQPFIGSADPYMFYLRSGVSVNEMIKPLAYQYIQIQLLTVSILVLMLISLVLKFTIT
jgi:hypothetical protein